MRRAHPLLAVGVLAMLAAGCLGGSSGGGDRSAAAHRPPTRVEVTYSAGFRRQCRDHVVGRCVPVRLRPATCPAGARCVAPVPSARLIQCPGQGRPGQHCFAVTREPDGAVLLLQQRELECSPAPRGRYADPAAACCLRAKAAAAGAALTPPLGA